MSLKQKYTWAQFKKEEGEKAKDLKRTSPEGMKAFKAAFAARTKRFVQNRMERLAKAQSKAQEQLTALQGTLKGLRSATRQKAVRKRISRKQHAMRDFSEQIERDKARTF